MLWHGLFVQQLVKTLRHVLPWTAIDCTVYQLYRQAGVPQVSCRAAIVGQLR